MINKSCVLGCLFGVLSVFTPISTASGSTNLEDNNRVEFLDNGIIRIGADLSIGGAITYLADKEHGINMVNSHDWGRQIQMSFYSGPNPFKPNGKEPKPAWLKLGWNPIQSGDAFGNRSEVIDYKNDGETLYVKCIPMQWPLDNEPGECTFETWIKLDGPAARIRSRINNHRSDHAQYQGRSQELPAVYTNGPWYRLITYQGVQPFTNDELTEIPIKKKVKGEFPWSRFQATENWSALVDKDGHGLGVWNHGIQKFLGGFHLQPGVTGPTDGPTGYIAPLHQDILDHNIAYEYDYQLIVGTIGQIRNYIYKHTPGIITKFDFTSDRQHWTYKNASDTGWPIEGGLHIKLDQDHPQILSPLGCWQWEDYEAIEITAAFNSEENEAFITCLPFQSEGSDPISISFKVIPDGKERSYRIPLNFKSDYQGAIKQLILLPCKSGRRESWMKLRSVQWIVSPEKSER